MRKGEREKARLAEETNSGVTTATASKFAVSRSMYSEG